MTSKTVTRALAVAIAAASLGFASGDAFAQKRGQAELVNRAAPFTCIVDEGYGRRTNCDQGGGGSN